MDLSIFGERLSELMFDAGLDERTLSIKLGFGESTIYHYLQGIRIPYAETVIIIADSLSVRRISFWVWKMKTTPKSTKKRRLLKKDFPSC